MVVLSLNRTLDEKLGKMRDFGRAVLPLVMARAHETFCLDFFEELGVGIGFEIHAAGTVAGGFPGEESFKVPRVVDVVT